MKRIRLLINNFHSTSFKCVARDMDIIRGVEVLNLQTYVLLETVGNNLAVFTAQSTKFYYIDSDEISEFLYRKHDIFTTCSERSTYFLALADNDVYGLSYCAGVSCIRCSLNMF